MIYFLQDLLERDIFTLTEVLLFKKKKGEISSMTVRHAEKMSIKFCERPGSNTSRSDVRHSGRSVAKHFDSTC